VGIRSNSEPLNNHTHHHEQRSSHWLLWGFSNSLVLCPLWEEGISNPKCVECAWDLPSKPIQGASCGGTCQKSQLLRRLRWEYHGLRLSGQDSKTLSQEQNRSKRAGGVAQVVNSWSTMRFSGSCFTCTESQSNILSQVVWKMQPLPQEPIIPGTYRPF
jgi:hypothetical protein